MKIAGTTAIRKADRIMIDQHHYPGILLMEEAGKQTTNAILQHYPDQTSFVILSGPGNNGGDGFVIARLLHLAEKNVEVLLSKPLEKLPDEGDAAVMLKILTELPVPVRQWGPGDLLNRTDQPLIIDALLGTGSTPPLRSPYPGIIQEANDSGLSCVAIDLPSGLSADHGQAPEPVIRSERTYTFHLPKYCHLISPASESCGRMHCLDIGIWPSVNQQLELPGTMLDEDWAHDHFQSRGNLSHKGSNGHLLIIGGSQQMSGATILATEAALRSGAGLVTTACPAAVREPLLTRCPEAMVLSTEQSPNFLTEDHVETIQAQLPRKTAIAIGPGMGLHPETKAFFHHILQHIAEQAPDIPVLLDADALTLLCEYEGVLPSRLILSPHPGEMKRLLADTAENFPVQEKRLEAVKAACKRWNATTILKGAGTIVTSHTTDEILVNTSGNAALAAGGTGDVLAGLVGAFLAQGYSDLIASGLGVYFHGKAADKWIEDQASEGLKAGDLPTLIPQVFPH